MKSVSFLVSSLILSILIWGCNPDEQEEITQVEIPMTFNCYLDGVNYNYSGIYEPGAPNSGMSAGSLGGGILNLVLQKPIVGGLQPFAVTIQLSMDTPQTGYFFVDSTSTSSNSISVIKMVNSNFLDPNNVIANSLHGGGITIHITEFGSESYQDNPSNPGRIKGDFQGIIKSPDNTEYIVSGSFDSVRQI